MSRPVFHLFGNEVVHQFAAHLLDRIRAQALDLGPLAQIKGIDLASDVLHTCMLCGLQLVDDFHVGDSVC